MKWKQCFLMFLHLAICDIVEAQSISFHRISVNNGLSNSTINSVVRDGTGFLWAGGTSLNRFDGYRVKVYPLENTAGESVGAGVMSLHWSARSGLWLGTNLGLSAFDPKTEKCTRHAEALTATGKQPLGLVRTLAETADGTLWIGSVHGLFFKDPQSGEIRQYPQQIQSSEIRSLFTDRSGALWVGGNDLFKTAIISANGSISYPFAEKHIGSLAKSSYEIVAIFEDSRQWLWFALRGAGFVRYSRSSGQLEHFPLPPGDTPYPTSLVNGFVEDQQGRIWIATDGGGIHIWDETQGRVQICQHDPLLTHSLGSNGIRYLYRDPQGLIWACTILGGLSYYDPWEKQFQHYQAGNGPNFLSNQVITAFAELPNGQILIGTDKGGLNRFDPQTGLFEDWQYDPTKPTSLSSNHVRAIVSDAAHGVWVGNFNGGINRFYPEKGTFQRIGYQADKLAQGPLGNHVWHMAPGNPGQVWVSAKGNPGSGLSLLDLTSGTFRHFTGRSAPQAKSINTLLQTADGRLWLGQEGSGLEVYEPSNGEWLQYDPLAEAEHGFSGKVINHLFADSQGYLWIATQDAGLFKFDPSTQAFTQFGTQTSLPDQNIVSIIEDNKGYLWLGTGKGLARFDPRTSGCWQFDTSDGLQGLEFMPGAVLRTANGELYFGGVNGFNRFHPDSIRANPIAPKSVLTELNVFYQPVKHSPESPILQAPLHETSEIRLNYDQSVFSIEFAGLNFTASQNNQYAFILEGYDPDWNQVGNLRQASYTNLPPGNYTFRVKSANNDGIWGPESAGLQIRILPPFWLTNWFKILAISILLLSIFTYVRLRIYALKRQKKRLELLVERRTLALEKKTQDLERTNQLLGAEQAEALRKNAQISEQKTQLEQQNERLSEQKAAIEQIAQQLQAANEAKTRFFANVSHDLRTPLTLILSPLALVLQDKSHTPKLQKTLYNIQQNAQKLLKLINQLLDIGKEPESDAEKTSSAPAATFQPSHENVYSFLQQEMSYFQEYASQREVQFLLESDHTELYTWLDTDKMEKALDNLLANAFRYVPQGGTIRLALSTSAGNICISVADNGPGIPVAYRAQIFERFFQVPNHLKNGSSGIGLSLVKEAAELHGGQVSCHSVTAEESSGNTGTTITLSFPQQASSEPPTHHRIHRQKTAPLPLSQTDKNQPSLVLVEDEGELREFITHYLSAHFRVKDFTNAEDALEYLNQHEADLLLSDVMLPGMAGTELCRKVKNQLATSHIPVVLLTARTQPEQEIAGLDCGADDYLGKPFSPQVLTARLQHLIKQREKLRQQFSRDFLKTAAEPTAAQSPEASFLMKAQKVAQLSLHEPGFGIEQWAEQLHMSTSSFYRKLKALTDQSPKDLLRILRLEKAAKLLENSDYQVAEIAYQVGFNDAKYFSRQYRQHFGILPSEQKTQGKV